MSEPDADWRARDRAVRRGDGGSPAAAPRSASVRGLTTRGRCLLAGGVAAAVCAFLLDERDLLRVGIFAVAVPVLAVLFTATRRPRLEVTHHVSPERLSTGVSGQVGLTIVNTGTSRSRAFELAESAVPGLTRGVRRTIPGLRPGHGCRITYPVTATRRGRFPVGPALASSHDLFGLWGDESALPGVSDLLVVPRVVRLSGLPAGAGSRSASSGRAASGATGGDPDVGIRHYRSGDDIRTIHWRASARHDELMVRLDEPVSHGGAVVLVDHRASAHRGTAAESSLETAVVLAASVSLHLLASDHEVRLAGHRSTIAHGHDIADTVLSGLAVVEADPGDQITLPPIGSAGMIIAILGSLDVADVSALVAGRPRGVQGVAMMLATSEWDVDERHPRQQAGLGVTAARSALQAAGWRTLSVGRGDDLALAWRRACGPSQDDAAGTLAADRLEAGAR